MSTVALLMAAPGSLLLGALLQLLVARLCAARTKGILAVLACLHLADKLRAAEKKLRRFEDKSEEISSLLEDAQFQPFAGIYAIAQTLAGPRASGKWVSFQNAAGNVAGMIGPVITGMVVDSTGQFFWAFALTAAVGLTGAIGWGVIIRRVAPLDLGT